MEEGIV